MKLTRRQEEFLRNLLDLYRQQQEPLHYSALAERLGVSRFTAYDMLRLLEEKGYARSTYQLADDKSGPGRSEVVYVPTAQAHQLIAQVLGEGQGDDWEAIKARILARVEAGTGPAHAVAGEILARVPPDEPEAIRYCVEVMTVIALRLREQAGRQLLFHYLPEILSPVREDCRASLSLLGGLALGILLDEAGDEQWARELLVHVRHYQRLLLEMRPERCRRLADTLQKVFAPLLPQATSDS